MAYKKQQIVSIGQKNRIRCFTNELIYFNVLSLVALYHLAQKHVLKKYKRRTIYCYSNINIEDVKEKKVYTVEPARVTLLTCCRKEIKMYHIQK